jgi:hypothetical protein
MSVTTPEPVPLAFEDVVSRGRPILEKIIGDLRGAVIRASDQPAYWHPTGFIVLNLRDVENLGLIRLHIWSRTQRLKRSGNPEVHAHIFHLTSFVLAGTYVERQYREHIVENGDAFGYRVVPPRGDGIDRLVREPDTYRLELLRTETTSAGSFHHLAAGVYHMTDNPEGVTCATVALLSRPQPGRVDHLIGPEDHDDLESRREVVDRTVLADALAEIGLSGVI